jgi:glycosyltransferase involved in cell wall biosynthesis
MKKVLIDLYKVKEIYSGLGQFSINFANEIMNQSPKEFNIIFLTPKSFETENFKTFNSLKVNLQKRYFPVFNKSYDIWHSLQQFPSYFPNKKSKFILTIHDLNFLFEKDGAKKLRYLKKLQKNIDRADYITTVSDYSKKIIEDNINLRGKSILTIYNGIEINSLGEGHKPAYVDDKKIFFSIGIFNKKKNFHVLLSLMNYFQDYQLIIAGNKDTSYGKQIQRQISDRNLADRVILPGKINEDEKRWLYSNCDAFLFPSLAEGFGMPLIEAMKFGKPVFLSKFTSLPEIGGDFAFYFDNFDEEYMSSFIKSKLSYYNNNLIILSDQIKKHADRFSWQKCIAQYLKLYHEIAYKIDATQ